MAINNNVREYIGARYVMKFADPIQHDSTLTYEPLIVVQNSGTSYVSKQYVPAGIAITDTNYWVRMADFNAQFESIRQQVAAYDSRINENTDAIADLNAQFEPIQQQVAAHDSRINENTDAIAEISDVIPMEDFSASNTIKDNFDTITSNVENINIVVEEQEYAKNQLENFYSISGNYCPNAIIEPMETFIDNNDKLFYATETTQSNWVSNVFNESLNKYEPMDVVGTVENGVTKFPGSCSTLVLTGLMGISYNNSRYANGTGIVEVNGSNATLKGGYNIPYVGSGFFSPQINAAAATKYGSNYGFLHSWQMAEYFNDLGILHPITEDYGISILKPGDILFYENWTGSEPHWNNINHCEIFCGFSTSSGNISFVVIEGKPTGNYAGFTLRNANSEMGRQLKWFARFPTIGATPKNIANTENFPINITEAGWTNISFNSTDKIQPNRAFSIIMEFEDGWENSRNNCHFNIGAYDSAQTGSAFDGYFGTIYLNSRFNQIGKNIFACVSHTNRLVGERARIQTIGNPNENLILKNIQIYDGVVAY